MRGTPPPRTYPQRLRRLDFGGGGITPSNIFSRMAPFFHGEETSATTYRDVRL